VKVSIVIPCYNEKDTIEEIVGVVRGVRAIYAIIKYNLWPEGSRPLALRRTSAVASISSVPLRTSAKIS
jgi:hypothetical protein